MMAKVGVVAAGGRLRSHFYCLMLKKIQFFIICDVTIFERNLPCDEHTVIEGS